MIHLYLSWKYIPGREGILTGIINIGVGAGGTLFTFLGGYLANPDSIDAKIKTNDVTNFKPFPEIAYRVPDMLRILLAIYAGLFVMALFTIQGYPDADTLQVKKEELEVKEKRYTIVGDTAV
jgi:MFS family permease